MTRSKWKAPFIQQSFYLKKNMQIISRNVNIIPKFVGFYFNVYNGKNFINIIVKKNMVNHKFGEFVFTRLKKINLYGTKN